MEFTVDRAFCGKRLDRYLALCAEGISRARMRLLIESGCVSSDNEVITDPRLRVREGQTFCVVSGGLDSVTVPSLSGRVLFQDDDLIVIDKPAGMVVHAGAGHAGGTLADALVGHVGSGQARIGQSDRPGIVHRLDKDTSGVIVAATSQRAYEALRVMFSDHAVERQYLAFTCSGLVPLAGEIAVGLCRDRGDFRRMLASDTDPSARRARTEYRTLRSFGRTVSGVSASLVMCRLHTGRTHQIRVHLSHAGAPVIGDRLYGGRRGIRVPCGCSPLILSHLRSFGRQALHACRLGFVHPVTLDSMSFESPLPMDMRVLGEELSDALGVCEVDDGFDCAEVQS